MIIGFRVYQHPAFKAATMNSERCLCAFNTLVPSNKDVKPMNPTFVERHAPWVVFFSGSLFYARHLVRIRHHRTG